MKTVLVPSVGTVRLYILWHLQGSYTKIPLKLSAINTNRFICIITKEFYKPIKNIPYILEHAMQFHSTLYISVHAIAVTDSYTAFSDTNRQIVLLVC